MIIRFGMLATDAYGKAGGQCIQRRGSIRVMRNITIPTQRIASQQNRQRFINSRLFSDWAFLPKETRDGWATVATFLSARNGWGEEKQLSGREAYTRLNSIVIAIGLSPIEPAAVEYTIPILELGIISINSIDKEFEIVPLANINGDYFQVKFMRLRSMAQNPLISKLKTATYLSDLTDAADNYDQLTASTGKLRTGDMLSISIRPITFSGITGIWSQLNLIVV